MREKSDFPSNIGAALFLGFHNVREQRMSAMGHSQRALIPHLLLDENVMHFSFEDNSSRIQQDHPVEETPAYTSQRHKLQGCQTYHF